MDSVTIDWFWFGLLVVVIVRARLDRHTTTDPHQAAGVPADSAVRLRNRGGALRF